MEYTPRPIPRANLIPFRRSGSRRQPQPAPTEDLDGLKRTIHRLERAQFDHDRNSSTGAALTQLRINLERLDRGRRVPLGAWAALAEQIAAAGGARQ